MSMSASLLRRAIELFREGKKDEANRLLKAVVRQEPTNQIAWNWYIETISDPQERVHTLEEYLLIYPESRQGLKALQALKQRGAAHETAIQPPNPLPTSLTEQAHPIPPASTSRPATAPLTAANATPKAAPSSAPHRSTSYAPVLTVFSILLLAVLLIYTFKLQQHHNTLQGLYDTLRTSYTELQISHEVTVEEKAQLKTRLDDLWIDYDYLNTAYNDLATAYIDIESRFNGLALEYINLDSQYNSLLQEYGPAR